MINTSHKVKTNNNIQLPKKAAPAAQSTAKKPDGLQTRAANQLLGSKWDSLGGKAGEAKSANPFFNNFLEGQSGSKPGGAGIATLRYPSDSDSDGGSKPGKPGGPKPPGAGIATLRYPSDSDSDGGGIKPGGPGGIKPGNPGSQPPGTGIATLRYPSDSDSDGGGLKPGGPGGVKPGGPIATLRYPSDSDSDGGGIKPFGLDTKPTR
ncbi:MAG: hypothetical protein AB7S38_20530 [Vulcanimicrobiota bacterium]